MPQQRGRRGAAARCSRPDSARHVFHPGAPQPMFSSGYFFVKELLLQGASSPVFAGQASIVCLETKQPFTALGTIRVVLYFSFIPFIQTGVAPAENSE